MEFLVPLIETVLWVIFAVWLVRRIFGRRPARQAPPPRVEKQSPAPMKTLHRDPSCGTYVAEDISRRLEEGGKTLHFCSEECRMRYIARQRHSARA
jgi:YHS domain-containing protein